jgi:hypothetical protein
MIRKVADVAIVAGGLAIGATVLAGLTFVGWILNRKAGKR